MEIAKPSGEDKARFRAIFESHPELEIKAMFGNLAAFVVSNQQMCAGLFGPAIGLRLAEGARVELLEKAGAGPFGPEGRPMKEYVSVPPGWVVGDSDEFDAWIDRAVEHTAAMPPKKPKKPKQKR